MDVHVKLDENGYIPDTYTKYAGEDSLYAGRPTRSFPFKVTGVPAGTATLAVVFYDVDSIPVCGFPWIHWCACNIPADVTEFPADASNLCFAGMVQGKNSTASRLVGSRDPLLTCRYNGPQPPDCDHTYTLRVYALDNAPQLKEGFWLNELLHAMEGHILAEAVAQLPSRV